MFSAVPDLLKSKNSITRCQNAPLAHSLKSRSSFMKHLAFVSPSKHKRVVGSRACVERLASGAVIADARCNLLSCHCSLLCSLCFLIILSAIYQILKSERTKKKIKVVVSLHYGLCQLF